MVALRVEPPLGAAAPCVLFVNPVYGTVRTVVWWELGAGDCPRLPDARPSTRGQGPKNQALPKVGGVRGPPFPEIETQKS